MEKNRMQKLDGIKEGTIFKNGKFKLDRWEVGQYNYHGAPDPYGKWCEAQDVAKLEELAAELLFVVEMAEENYYDGLGDEQSVAQAARKVIEKVKSL